ncbi:MAG: hypothetical protein Q8Q08_06790 [Candidatus Omnitrophota bacterium]|nr:hypothetical protein [Candidatus Omnitrophota bacterium]MDZ4241637.1 hypothetical protein [Candidatus Omnitrophota bacterium]
MPNRNPLQAAGLLFLVLAWGGCDIPSPPPVVTITEAQSKFSKICRDEFKYSPLTRTVGNTVWIYFPMDEELLTLKPSPDGPKSSDQAKEKPSLRFLDVKFDMRTIHVRFDIANAKQYAQDPGYQFAYPEHWQQKQQNLLSAVVRAYGDVGEIPGDLEFKDKRKDGTHNDLVNAYVKPDKAPDFFVIVFADMKNGMEMKNITNFTDLKNAFSPTVPLAQEEFTMRFLSEVYGNAAVVDDRLGRHLDWTAVDWRDFLSRQIKQRINFKFTQSDFPPSADADFEELILKAVSASVAPYQFEDFDSVKLTDMNTGRDVIITKAQLATFKE